MTWFVGGRLFDGGDSCCCDCVADMLAFLSGAFGFIFSRLMFCVKYNTAILVGKLSDFMSGAGRSVRFQQCKQLKSPFSVIIELIHFRQK